ncbi:putative ATPase [Mycobacterium sp. OAS707]|uniref:ATP-binding protein n=1 Tax=Mycobacterium sp. OAS707 TaxID=2663822 RepID=UPI00178C06B3|nr:adenylate/guanylate cyclase domain-containing protein [Mycobacterium sp. OAS707]MBE1546255.1 putative ATPase [Mycobacterium sp. OAS707]
MRPPSGVVTFLFTDIEGSTRRWEADAASMRAALLAHDKVLRTAIEAHEGFLFSHTGDGVVAAFASPRAAVDAAIDAQRALELPVRMGIATGEAELRDGDYFGTVLNRAARVMAAGHGGQVLVAESTAGLLSGLDLVDLGQRRLRDVPSPVNIFQLRAPGLREDFPPLRTAETTPGNLRRPATSFIGRDSAIAEVETAVRAHRLVTLTGSGGVGKTRLALEVGARLAAEFPDGTWVFELAAIADPDAVPDAAAAVLGITQQPGKTVSDSVAAALEGRTRLLIFDNCEHVRDTVGDLVETILARSSSVRILATSREGLGVEDERVWLVPSLEVRTGLNSAAARLFVDRAVSVASHFAVADSEDANAVTEICRRLDGIPLAIELAASRMASMTASDVRDRLDHRFRLLVGTRRGLERHQTLRHAVAWSYDLLSDEEKTLLTRCSVFTGGFDVESARAVGGLNDDFATLDLLDALVRKSLVVAGRSAGKARYSMLETVRQFAEEQLAEGADADAARATHASYFAAREDDILALWNSPRQRDAYAWFNTELANLRTAFRWAAEHDDLDTAAPVATYAALFGVLTENFEPVTWVEELIPAARAADHPRLTSLYLLATHCWMVGRIDQAVQYGDEGQALVDSGRYGVPRGLESWSAGVSNNIGLPEDSIEAYRRMLARRDDDPYGLTRSGLALGLMRAGSPAEAMAVAKDLVDSAGEIINPWGQSYALLVYGMAWCDADPAGARDALRRGLAIAQDSGIRYNESHLASVLGRLEARHGDARSALEYLQLSIGNYHDCGNTSTLRVPLASLAACLERLEYWEGAAVIAGFASGHLARAWLPELGSAIAHLRDVLGDQRYVELSEKGAAMTAATLVAYAYDQIDQARVELERSQ